MVPYMANDVWEAVLEAAKHSGMRPDELAASLIKADEVIQEAIQPVSSAQPAGDADSAPEHEPSLDRGHPDQEPDAPCCTSRQQGA